VQTIQQQSIGCLGVSSFARLFIHGTQPEKLGVATIHENGQFPHAGNTQCGLSIRVGGTELFDPRNPVSGIFHGYKNYQGYKRDDGFHQKNSYVCVRPLVVTKRI
jgi:hypothetical protein